jgi:hypothetical protein
LVALSVACGDAASTGDEPEGGGSGATRGRVAGTSGAASGSGGAGDGSVAGAGGNGAGAGATSTGGTSAAGASASGTGASNDAGSSNDAESGGSGSSSRGNMGIAAKYPGDVGIAGDPEVVFADDFESYSTDAMGPEINQVWDAVYQNQYVSIATEPANVNGGSQALEFTIPQQDAELSDAADKVLDEALDVLHLRYYSKFQPPYDVIGSSHNGASISAQYFDGNDATPGVPANGTNKFLVNLENWRGDEMTPSPGQLNVYVYHPEQRSEYGDHFYPTGLVNPNTSIPFDFGADFVERPDVIPELDRWYCYEYMVQANTPGQRDGRIAIWLDGELVADFGNLRLRDVDDLKIDRFGLSFHIKSNPNGQSKKWYDDVVAATSYIGCIAP